MGYESGLFKEAIFGRESGSVKSTTRDSSFSARRFDCTVKISGLVIRSWSVTAGQYPLQTDGTEATRLSLRGRETCVSPSPIRSSISRETHIGRRLGFRIGADVN